MSQKSNQAKISCESCRTCEDHCKKRIPIPDILDLFNRTADRSVSKEELRSDYQKTVTGRGKASDCALCLRCEEFCPQRLRITEALRKAARLLE